MDISKLSEQQKSQLLAQARGWRVTGNIIVPDDETITRTRISYPIGWNLYLAPNMALAWDIHLWAIVNLPTDHARYYFWWFRSGEELEDPPWTLGDVQRLLLDKIFELCVEVGIIRLGEKE